MEKFCLFLLMIISLSSLIHGMPHHNGSVEIRESQNKEIESSTGKSLNWRFIGYFNLLF